MDNKKKTVVGIVLSAIQVILYAVILGLAIRNLLSHNQDEEDLEND